MEKKSGKKYLHWKYFYGIIFKLTKITSVDSAGGACIRFPRKHKMQMEEKPTEVIT